MHNFLGEEEDQDYQMRNPQQQGGGNNNPFAPLGDSQLGMAGLLLAGGVPFSKALAQGSQLYAQQQTSNAQAQEIQQKQGAMQLKQRALQALQANKDNPEAVDQILYSGVFDGREIKSLSESLGGGAEKLVTGANGIKYTQGRNSETGKVELSVVPGQIERPAITASEIRANKKTISDASAVSSNAVAELRLLKDGEKYFEKFNKAHSKDSLLGTGSIYNKIAPSFLDNIFLSEEGQTAKQEIGKVESYIGQGRSLVAGNTGNTDEARANIKKGLPSIGLTKEAFNEVIRSKTRENSALIAKSLFLNEWYKINGGDLTGAEDSFNSFVMDADLVKDGRPNEKTLREIPKIVRKLVDQEMQYSRGVVSSQNNNNLGNSAFGNENGIIGKDVTSEDESLIEGARRELARRRQQSTGF